MCPERGRARFDSSPSTHRVAKLPSSSARASRFSRDTLYTSCPAGGAALTGRSGGGGWAKAGVRPWAGARDRRGATLAQRAGEALRIYAPGPSG